MNKILLSALLITTFAFAEAEPGQAKVEETKAPSVLTPEQIKVVEEIVLKQIEKNPEVLIKAVQQFGEKQQQESIKKLEEALNKSTDDLLKTTDAIAVGSETAAVKIVAFIDPNCPHCRTFEKNVNTVKDGFENLQILYRQFPILGDESEAVARGLIAAHMQGKFPNLSAKVSESQDNLTQDKFLELAKAEKGLDLAKLTKDMNSEEVKNQIKRTKELAGKLGIESTPTMIVIDKQGARLIMGNDVDTLKQTLERAAV